MVFFFFGTEYTFIYFKSNYNLKFPKFRPKHKYIRITKDDHFKTEEHHLSLLPLKAEKSCSYDMDDVDTAWLKLCNGERSLGGNFIVF